MVNLLVFEAIKNEDKINESRFALLKILEIYNVKAPADFSVVIYTDKPQMFESFTPFFNSLELVEQSTPLSRLQLLRLVLANREANVLYCDTYTYINTPIESIFTEIKNGSLFLLEKPNAFNVNNHRVEWKGKQLNFHEIGRYTTAVTGISSASIHILDDCEAIAAALFKEGIPNAEEIAMIHCFLQSNNLRNAAEIMHYKEFREFRYLLKIFFQRNEEESIPNLVKIIHHLDVDAIQKEKTAYESLPLLRKWLRMAKGEKWSIKKYETKF